MYKNQLRVHGEYLAKEQTIPANTTEVGNGGSCMAGSMLGAAEIAVVATSAVTVADGATLTFSVQGSDDDATFTDDPVRYEKTASGAAMTYAVGDVVARLPLASDARKYVKVVMGTTDAAATGAVDIFFEYLPR